MGPLLGTVHNLSYFYLLNHIIIIPILLLPFKPPLLSSPSPPPFFFLHENTDPQGTTQLAHGHTSEFDYKVRALLTILLPSYFKGVSGGEVPGRSQEKEGIGGRRALGRVFAGSFLFSLAPRLQRSLPKPEVWDPGVLGFPAFFSFLFFKLSIFFYFGIRAYEETVDWILIHEDLKP